MAESDVLPTRSSTGMEPNVAGLLAYIAGLVTGIIFWLIEKESPFVRFHAMQSILFAGSWLVISFVLSFIPLIGWLLALVINLGMLVVWIMLMVKAYQGERYKLPVIGDIAERQVSGA